MSIKRKRPVRAFLASVAFIALYFALFPYPLGKELVARPVWAVEVPASAPLAPSGSAQDVTEAAWFKINGLFGYVSGGGQILFLGRPIFEVALTSVGFINYSRVGTTWLFQDTRGERKFAFSGSGYPLLSNDAERLFTVSSDLTGIKELDRSGDVLWSRDFPCLMTGISLQENVLAVGLLNGNLQLVDRHGALVSEYTPSASRIPVVLGCVVSNDGSRVAALSGIDPQFLTVLERQGSAYSFSSRAVLASDFRREVRMGYSPDSRFLLFEGTQSVELYDAVGKTLSSIPLSGGLSHFAFLSGNEAAVLGGIEPQRELLIVKPPDSLRSREAFTARSVFLGKIGDGVLLGIDNRLLRIDFEAM